MWQGCIRSAMDLEAPRRPHMELLPPTCQTPPAACIAYQPFIALESSDASLLLTASCYNEPTNAIPKYFSINRKQLYERTRNVLFIPEYFYYTIAEYPDLLGPALLSFGCLTINSAVRYALRRGSWHENLLSAANLLLAIYLYVAVVPAVAWLWHCIIKRRNRTGAFRDTVLLATCLGYSLVFDCIIGMLLYVFNEMRIMIFIFVVYQSGSFLCKSAGRLSFSQRVLAEESASNAFCCWLCMIACILFNGYLCFLFK